MRIRTLDAPAHLEDLNVAVMQYVVDVGGQTLNGRAVHVFDALSTTRSLQAHDAIRVFRRNAEGGHAAFVPAAFLLWAAILPPLSS
jgi:hypothetical protein